MPYPEPSLSDHGAPWNEVEDEETGEVYCGCTSCRAKRRKRADEERSIDDYEHRRKP
jgi:hypothetical protein